MRSGHMVSAPGLRLWWTVPLGLVLLTAVVFVAVVLPALASAPNVPSQLVVHPSTAEPTSAATATPRPTHTPRPPATTSATPAPMQAATVVVAPSQPVVRESEGGHDDSGGTASGEPRDR